MLQNTNRFQQSDLTATEAADILGPDVTLFITGGVAVEDATATALEALRFLARAAKRN